MKLVIEKNSDNEIIASIDGKNATHVYKDFNGVREDMPKMFNVNEPEPTEEEKEEMQRIEEDVERAEKRLKMRLEGDPNLGVNQI